MAEIIDRRNSRANSEKRREAQTELHNGFDACAATEWSGRLVVETIFHKGTAQRIESYKQEFGVTHG